jgi:hypothetical protein
MRISIEKCREEIRSLLPFLVDAHYPATAQKLAPSSLYLEGILLELADELATRIETWSHARDTGPGTLADCVLLAVKALHQELCHHRGQKPDYCARDVRFGASLASILAICFMTPLVRPPESLINSSLKAESDAIRRDLLEIAFEQVLNPIHFLRALPSIETDTPNIQINSPVSKVKEGAFLRTRAEAKYVEAAIAAEHLNIEVTSDWVDTVSKTSSTQLDGIVDSAILRTAGMILFANGGRIGTGETLRLAAQVLMPVLVLRRSDNQPLEARRRGVHSIRVERVYKTKEEALGHVKWFLGQFRPQILARQRFLERVAGQAGSLERIRDAVESLDPAVFETSQLTRAGALFYSSDPLHFYQASDVIKAELKRIASPVRATSASAPGTSPGQTFDNSAEVLRRERASTASLHTAAELYGWTYAVVQRLAGENWRRESRQATSRSHALPPMQVLDWVNLHVNVFGA